MKKKGFTLVEIIAVVAIIAVLGVASFVGIRLVNKNIRITKLQQITDKAIEAAEVYLETNKESYNQLYEEQNGVVIPLNVLVNEGLLSLENTDLDKDDIEDEYVVTALSSSSGSNSNCVDIRTSTSWYEGSSAPIYICTKSDGSTNIQMIDINEVGNINVVNREMYTFRGSNANNYIKYGSNTYRIMHVDIDNTLILYNGSSFESVFSESDTLPINEHSSYGSYENSAYVYCNEDMMNYEVSFPGTSKNGEAKACAHDLSNTSLCYPVKGEISSSTSWSSELEVATNFMLGTWIEGETSNYNGSSSYAYRAPWYYYRVYPNDTGYKIHLNNKFKITGGTGTSFNPYILEKKS